ncbi:prepilin-type N-terminal cleavage/methylation domain-containing protein [Cupriavidus sp. D39]|uniref:prepilin-type N-terminal cleavage/methylation domain-containing protein n=1 Tax=Cupriavidus sp. D39 TaxID=2997877 RepID=UPI002D1E40A9|nr:prepilin-type N-terminal cleavage/methylation domain-containing protein [Cupriavidus sp. D39]
MTPCPRPGGFTLLELLITLTVSAILMAMVMPAWHQHMARGWRAEARSALIGVMLDLERHALATMSFAAQPGGATVGRQVAAAGARPSGAPASLDQRQRLPGQRAGALRGAACRAADAGCVMRHADTAQYRRVARAARLCRGAGAAAPGVLRRPCVGSGTRTGAGIRVAAQRLPSC